MKNLVNTSVFILIAFFASSVFAGKPTAPLTVEGTTLVTTEEAKKLFDEGVLFIDARRIDHIDGHIPNAINISTKNDLSEEALLKAIKKDGKAVFYCHGVNCPASSKGLMKAVSWGFTNLYYYREGFNAWKAAGNPITKNDFKTVSK